MMILFFCYSINYLICNIIVRSVRIESAKFGGGGDVEGPKEARSLGILLWANTALALANIRSKRTSKRALNTSLR